jgi:hypothetical protein
VREATRQRFLHPEELEVPSAFLRERNAKELTIKFVALGRLTDNRTKAGNEQNLEVVFNLHAASISDSVQHPHSHAASRCS